MDVANLGIIIPRGVENLQLPDDSLLNFYEGLERRIFWVNDEINVYSLNLIHYIMKWNQEDLGIPVEKRKPIKLLFFSPGGDIDANYAIIDTIKLSKTPIVGINIGQCASAAAFIFLSCHQRYMLSHSYFLFHQGSGQLSGTFAEIYAQMEDYQAQVEELASFMAKHTLYTEEEIAEKIVNEWYIRKDEAIEKGVCQKVIDNIDELV
jgi:ATP-dependent Clp protease, protease subunit